MHTNLNVHINKNIHTLNFEIYAEIKTKRYDIF